MEVIKDFLSTPPIKTVRFGGNVVNVLAKLKEGDTSDFELIRHQLADPDIKDAQIINWLQEFRTCVTQLGKEHEQLIYCVLSLPWLDRSPAVAEEYLAFLGNLISAQTVYLRPCLKTLVSSFTPRRIKIHEGNVDISDSDDDDENLPRIFDLCHQALQMIARYVPSTSRFLMPILNAKFPFVQKSSRTLECYVHNLLRIVVYMPALRRDVLELVISKMLMLDVSAPRGEIEEVESSGQQNQSAESQEEFLFDMDDDDGDGSPLKTSQSVDGAVMLHPVAERLDMLMSVLLAFIKDMCHVNGVLDVERAKGVYRDLVGVFDKLVLPTHASCHVQYCMFYLCSFRLGLAEAFLDHLWKLLQSPSLPAVIRQAAAAYMGSFLARAKFLPIATVRVCLDLLVPWLHLYIENQDSGSKVFCDISLHGPFYAACQAVFYTLIFRHKAILEGNMKKGLAYLQSLNLERIVMSQLNPLKVCLPAVTNLFAAITRKYQLVFCYTIIERNNRQMLPVIRSSVGGDSLSTNTNPLDTFFPFDPYLLKRSGKLIEPIYQVWEEPSDCMLDVPKKDIRKSSAEDEDDFLQDETPQGDVMMGVTPGSFDSHLRSPSSVGSPPIAFLQRPF
ncbi:RNA polymerase I-specific transcription initiation factor RRN3 [Pygocentrus nattereri]|uniref:RRN3 homolog, RNA polymerase I transcription factor n=1 Tax=Pygocentrus nattereri TaxID=42514 RepID=A0A3B4C8B5_PYGNA|nr:RNA polymerase I-specific transcription initiation factor RRN3 [Pygocentrus nattereri]